MNTDQTATIDIRVDPANPGQFFACCGLLELADRLWGGAEGWFSGHRFKVRPLGHAPVSTDLSGLITTMVRAGLEVLDETDQAATPLELPEPFQLRLDWWRDTRAGGKQLKVWAGSMVVSGIAQAMLAALNDPRFHQDVLFNVAMVVPDPENPRKKKEPFYFDARRGANALPLDVGFSTNKLEMRTMTCPAVELLCLIGLQRHRPRPATATRTFEYWTWCRPIENRMAPLMVCGQITDPDTDSYRFKCQFRSDQRKHKAFSPAQPRERRTK